MDNNESFYLIVNLVLYNIANLIFVVASIILVRKVKNIATILILIGNILCLFFFWLSFVGIRIAAQTGSEGFIKFNQIMSFIGPFPTVLSGIGLLLFVVRYLKRQPIG